MSTIHIENPAQSWRPSEGKIALDCVGIFFREERQTKKLTLVAVSNKTGLSVSYISDLERGVVSPSLKTLTKLMAFYGYKVTLYAE